MKSRMPSNQAKELENNRLDSLSGSQSVRSSANRILLDGYTRNKFGNTIGFKRRGFFPAGKGHNESERPLEIH